MISEPSSRTSDVTRGSEEIKETVRKLATGICPSQEDPSAPMPHELKNNISF